MYKTVLKWNFKLFKTIFKTINAIAGEQNTFQLYLHAVSQSLNCY